jgi:AcrR family transcriptional regulator
MADRRYHHGDLRAALLAQAEATLRVSGVDGLSLRELAREVGVSHGAPRRHFDDKAALLEALVAEGFRRLGSELAASAETDGRAFNVVLKDVAVSYVRFAADNPALVDLMSGSRYLADASDALVRARDLSFAPVRSLVEAAQSTGDLAPGDVRRIGTLMFATLHGLATMANNKMIDPLDDQLISDAVDSMLTGLAPAPVLPDGAFK